MEDRGNTDVAGVLKALRVRQAELRKELGKIEAGIAALESLTASSVPFLGQTEGDPSRMMPFGKLSKAAAAEAILTSEGKGLSTRELWQKMQEGGITSESGNPINVVYAVLSKDKRFCREGRLWQLVAKIDEQ
jgi:hypothetical protein